MELSNLARYPPPLPINTFLGRRRVLYSRLLPRGVVGVVLSLSLSALPCAVLLCLLYRNWQRAISWPAGRPRVPARRFWRRRYYGEATALCNVVCLYGSNTCHIQPAPLDYSVVRWLDQVRSRSRVDDRRVYVCVDTSLPKNALLWHKPVPHHSVLGLHKIAIYARLHVRLNIIFFYAIKSRLLPYSFTVLDIVLALGILITKAESKFVIAVNCGSWKMHANK